MAYLKTSFSDFTEARLLPKMPIQSGIWIALIALLFRSMLNTQVVSALSTATELDTVNADFVEMHINRGKKVWCLYRKPSRRTLLELLDMGVDWNI